MFYLIQNPESPNQEIHNLILGENTIGREVDNNIIAMYSSVSRYHAKLIVTASNVIIQDLNSRNCTFVNETKIDECELQNGDLIRCGNVVFKVVHTPGISQPDTLADDYYNISILGSLSPDQNSVKIEDLLYQDNLENAASVLKLRQQDANQRALDKLKILLEVSKQQPWCGLSLNFSFQKR